MKFIWALAALVFWGIPVKAEVGSYGFETLTVTTSTVVGLTAGKFIARSGGNRGGTTRVFCTSETDSVRFRVDGSSPTASVGHLVAAGSSLVIEGYEDARAARFIGSGSNSASLQCTFSSGKPD